MAAAGASAEYADFAVDVGQGTQELIGPVEVAKHLIVGDAAGGADFRADIFRRAVTIAEI